MNMILNDKTSYFAARILEFSGLNDKISGNKRTVSGSKCFFD